MGIKAKGSDVPDNEGDKLQSDLLRIEVKCSCKQLRYLNRIKDAREAEYDSVADRRDDDGGFASKQYGLVEIVKAERFGIDAAEREVLLLEGGFIVRTSAEVAGFGEKEDVEDELDGVGLRDV